MMFVHALTRKPPFSMQNGITTQDDKVDMALAHQQHETYVATLKSLNINVDVLPPLEEFPDSHFVEDAAILYKQNAIMTFPGAISRRDETHHLKGHLAEKMQVHTLSTDATALLDGGDVIVVSNKVLIGISKRTNYLGAEKLKNILRAIDSSVEVSFVEFDGVLHLKSGLVALSPYILLGNPNIKLKKPIEGFEIMWLPKKQGYAANCLVANGHALIFPDCDAAEHAVIDAGLKPISLDLSEFRKMDGSFTCLSLLW